MPAVQEGEICNGERPAAETLIRCPPVAGRRVRSKVVLMESIHQVLDILLEAEEPRVVHWDGRILRMHKLTSRKARQIFQSPQSFPGLLGVYDQKAQYRDIAEPLGDILGVHL